MCGGSDELLRRWLNGEEDALLAWLKDSNPMFPRPPRADLGLLLAHQFRAIAERERQLDRRKSEVEALRAELQRRRTVGVPAVE